MSVNKKENRGKFVAMFTMFLLIFCNMLTSGLLNNCTGAGVRAGRRCCSQPQPRTRPWTALTATAGSGCGLTRRWPSPATSASTRAPRAGRWSGEWVGEVSPCCIMLYFVSRYHCFPCDYTLCSDCARNIEAILRGSWNRKPNENVDKIYKKLIVFQS